LSLKTKPSDCVPEPRSVQVPLLPHVLSKALDDVGKFGESVEPVT
jgi:hypothetical protein